MDEFEKKLGGKPYSTIILIPHARAKFRKIKVSHRLIFSFLSLLVSSLLLSFLFSITYFTRLNEQVHVRSSSTRKLEQELAEANARMTEASRQLARSLENFDALSQHLLREQRSREQQLLDVQNRYESLKALAEGQEKIAEAHRAILQRRTMGDRLIEIGFGFSMGIVSSLVASFLWFWLRAKPITTEEAEKLDID